MKVIITGTNGNLGSALYTQLMSSQIDVHGVNRENWGELTGLLEGADAVVHVAGDVKSNLNDALSDVLHSNIMITAELLEILVQFGVKKFYYVSSCAVYGAASNTTESVPPNPISFNGKVKRFNEEFIGAYCDAHEISHTSFRVFNMYGGKDRFSIVHHLKESIKKDRPFKMCNYGVSRRDFIHVNDVAEIITQCVIFNKSPDILNIGTGVTVSVADLVEAFQVIEPSLQIEATFGREVEYSRADTTLLKELIGNYTFRDVLSEINGSVADGKFNEE